MGLKTSGTLGAAVVGSVGTRALDAFKPLTEPFAVRPADVFKAVDKVHQGLDWLAGKVKENIIDPIQEKVDALNPEKQVSLLKDGDTYSVGIGMGGSIELAKGDVHSGTTVTARAKKDANGDPVLDANGQPKLEYVVAHSGGLSGGVGNDNAGATLGGDANIEMVVDNPHDAVKAMELLNRPRPANPTPGHLDPPVLSADEQQFMRAHTTAIELSGTGAAQVATAYGLKLDNNVNLGQAGAGASTTATLRLDMDPQGRVTKATVKSSVNVDGQTPLGQLDTRDGQAHVNVTVEDSYTLPPPGMSLADAVNDPRRAAQQLSQAERAQSLTVTGTEQHGEVGHSTELKITGKPGEVLSPEVIAKAEQGDLAGAARTAGDKVQVSVNVTEQKRHGLNVDINLNVFEAKAQAERTESTPIFSKTASGTRVAEELEKQRQRETSNPLLAELQGARLVARARS